MNPYSPIYMRYKLPDGKTVKQFGRRNTNKLFYSSLRAPLCVRAVVTEDLICVTVT